MKPTTNDLSIVIDDELLDIGFLCQMKWVIGKLSSIIMPIIVETVIRCIQKPKLLLN